MKDDAPQRDSQRFGARSDAADDAGLTSGGHVPGTARPAYSLQRSGEGGLPVLIAVPHAGRAYPPGLIESMRHGEMAAQRLEDRFVDRIGRMAAAACGASLLVAHVPRAMIDLNRDTGDIDRGMFSGPPPSSGARLPDLPRQQSRAARGLGLFPRRLPGLGELWRQPLSAEEAERRIAAVHVPYHLALGRELARLKERHGYAILIDLHSMPSLPPAGRGASPTHVVGDRFGASCASSLAASSMELLSRALAVPAYNRPYAGGYVLDRHGRPRQDIHALQLEIDRARYLDQAGQPREQGTGEEGRIVSELAQLLAGLIAGGGWPYSDAAE